MVSLFFELSTYKFSKNDSAEISLSLIFLWMERISFSSIGDSFFWRGISWKVVHGSFASQSGIFWGATGAFFIPIPEEIYVVCPHFGQVTAMVKCWAEISSSVISPSVTSWCEHSLHEKCERVFLRSAWKRWYFIQKNDYIPIIYYFPKNSKYFSAFEQFFRLIKYIRAPELRERIVHHWGQHAPARVPDHFSYHFWRYAR